MYFTSICTQFYYCSNTIVNFTSNLSAKDIVDIAETSCQDPFLVPNCMLMNYSVNYSCLFRRASDLLWFFWQTSPPHVSSSAFPHLQDMTNGHGGFLQAQHEHTQASYAVPNRCTHWHDLQNPGKCKENLSLAVQLCRSQAGKRTKSHKCCKAISQ